uniref:Uncharacterized protein n=1 Tax=Eptatretus burgeri TaxID=7764 RepID=A0A8C4NM88_EPTBU
MVHLLHALMHQTKLVERLSETWLIRRAAQLTVYAVNKARLSVKGLETRLRDIPDKHRDHPPAMKPKGKEQLEALKRRMTVNRLGKLVPQVRENR